MSRNSVSIENNDLVVVPQGLDKLWSFTREIRVPLSLVRGSTYDPGAVAGPKGVRAPGLNTGGKKVSGTYRINGERHFWNITGASNVLVVELDPSFKYNRLILSVDDPVGLERQINAAIHAADF